MRRRTVAIIDDDWSVLQATEDLLEARGFKTLIFSSAEAFLSRKSDGPLDCLLLDINLTGLSGIDLRCQLKNSGSTVPVIFMTALDHETIRWQALKAGCAAFLRKPLFAAQLFEAIDKALTCTDEPILNHLGHADVRAVSTLDPP